MSPLYHIDIVGSISNREGNTFSNRVSNKANNVCFLSRGTPEYDHGDGPLEYTNELLLQQIIKISCGMYQTLDFQAFKMDEVAYGEKITLDAIKLRENITLDKMLDLPADAKFGLTISGSAIISMLDENTQREKLIQIYIGQNKSTQNELESIHRSFTWRFQQFSVWVKSCTLIENFEVRKFMRSISSLPEAKSHQHYNNFEVGQQRSTKMVKKVTRNSTAGNSSGAGLGYVYNDDLLDEILGEYDPSLAPKKRKMAKHPPAPAKPETPKEEVMEVDEEGSESEDYYEVDKILDKRQIGKRFQYLVKWVGFSEAEATWEPPSNLQNLINIYSYSWQISIFFEEDIINRRFSICQTFYGTKFKFMRIPESLQGNVEMFLGIGCSTLEGTIILEEQRQVYKAHHVEVSIYRVSKFFDINQYQCMMNVKNIVKEFELAYGMNTHGQQSTNASNKTETKSISQNSKDIAKKTLAPMQQATTGGFKRGGRLQRKQDQSTTEVPEDESLDKHLAKLAQQKQLILQQQQQIQEEETRMLKQIEEKKQKEAAAAAAAAANEAKEQSDKAAAQQRMSVKQLFGQRKKQQEEVKQAPQAVITPTPTPVEQTISKPEKKPTLGAHAHKLGFLKKKNVVGKKATQDTNAQETATQATTVTPAPKAPTNGAFENGDIPERVVGAKMSNGAIQVTLEWKTRDDGSKPLESIFTNDVVKYSMQLKTNVLVSLQTFTRAAQMRSQGQVVLLDRQLKLQVNEKDFLSVLISIQQFSNLKYTNSSNSICSHYFFSAGLLK